jgi:hypothetical protein
MYRSINIFLFIWLLAINFIYLRDVEWQTTFFAQQAQANQNNFNIEYDRNIRRDTIINNLTQQFFMANLK